MMATVMETTRRPLCRVSSIPKTGSKITTCLQTWPELELISFPQRPMLLLQQLHAVLAANYDETPGFRESLELISPTHKRHREHAAPCMHVTVGEDARAEDARAEGGAE